ncbi:MAG: LCP family protein, partial [Clostridiales bacterium]|nr:LCP family protein [Clostridiales bacterium]
LLLGLDELEGTTWARNDTTMILQINLDNNELKLVSFMRDMYVDIPSQGPYRLNNAHYRGGPELAIQTMKSVFDVDIDYYATVDFIAFERIMKIIGPVVIRIMDYEMEHINKLESAVSIDNDPMSGSIQNPGLNEINEYQALSYARDRHSSGDDNERAGDYGRNERQREIVKAAWTKVKSNQLVAIPAAVFAASVYAETNISPKLLITLLQTMMENNAEMIDMAIPVEGKFWAAWIEEDTKTKYSSDELFDKYESEKEKFEEDQADDSASSGSGDPSPTPAPAPTPAATQEDKQEFPSYETWRLRKGYASVIDWSQKNINALHEFLGSN